MARPIQNPNTNVEYTPGGPTAGTAANGIFDGFNPTVVVPGEPIDPIDVSQQDKVEVGIGVSIPFTNTDGGLFPITFTTRDQAISNLKNLLLTRKGERLFLPTFGTNIQDVLFEPNFDTLKEILIFEIESAVEFWLPYITIQSIDVETIVAVGASKEENGIRITMLIDVVTPGSNVPITIIVTPSVIDVTETNVIGTN